MSELTNDEKEWCVKRQAAIKLDEPGMGSPSFVGYGGTGSGSVKIKRDVDLHATADAAAWARQFVATFGGDEARVLGWFASAIEAGRNSEKLNSPKLARVSDILKLDDRLSALLAERCTRIEEEARLHDKCNAERTAKVLEVQDRSFSEVQRQVVATEIRQAAVLQKLGERFDNLLLRIGQVLGLSRACGDEPRP